METTNRTSIFVIGMKSLKWILISLFALFLLISLSIYLLRDKVIGVVVSEINKTLNTPVEVEELSLTFWSSFPNLSVDFNEVFIKDACPNAKASDTLFYSERIRLKLNPFDLLKNNYRIREIEVFPGTGNIKTWANGEVNYDIVAKDKNASDKAVEFTLNSVEFHNFKVGYWNEKAKQDYVFRLNQANLSGDFQAKKTLLALETESHLISIKNEGITLLKNIPAALDLRLIVDQTTHTVTIPKTDIQIGNMPFALQLASSPEDLRFTVESKNLKLTELAQQLNHQSTSKIKDFQGAGTLDFQLNYHQEQHSIPKIAASFGIQNGQIVEPSQNIPIKQIHLKGKYSNHDPIHGDLLEVSSVRLTTKTGPFEGNIRITQFQQPHVVGSVNGKIDLGVLHAIFPLPTIENTSGVLAVKGDFDVVKTPEELQLNNCKAHMAFNEVKIQQVDDKRLYDHINGAVYYHSDTVGVDKLSLTVGQSDLALKGNFQNIQNYFSGKENLKVDMRISSAYLNVQDFSSSSKAEEIANGRNFILPADIEGTVRLISNHLSYEKHTFKKLASDLVIGNRKLDFTNLALQNAEADIRGHVSISENSPEIFTIETQANTNNLAFKPLFKEWNNFDQHVITADQISGHASVDLDFKAPFDLRSGIKKEAILAQIHLKVQDGRLNNVTAFKEITQSLKQSKTTRLLLKQNNINHFEEELLKLKFDNFENDLTIANGRVFIPNMQIKSNALDVNLSGTHDFDNQVDYRFNFNFRDLKKQKMQTEFGEIEDDGTGFKLFVHMFGPMDNPTIKWDQEAHKLMVKENLQMDKQNTKAMLKSELGMFKKDTSVVAYVPKVKARESIQIIANPEEEPEPVTPAPKEGKLNKTFQKWKQEAEKQKNDKSTVVSGF